ncbi:MAG: TetR/AcrR family transcriptional regulator [Methanosphaera sp.]|nr:TetR/AcrR family transcriptional regulator [Methanosphaera sp.]
MFNQRENTEEKILNATFKILQKEGVGKATTKRIAAEAGVNEVTIFRKFDNKQNLIEKTKDHFIRVFIDKLRGIFYFNGDEDIEEYLRGAFMGVISLSDNDFSILKIAMEEVREIPERKLLIIQITDVILDKLEDFFKLQKEKGTVKDIDARVMAVMCFSIIFQSAILRNVYSLSPDYELDYYSENIFDVLFNGIKP